MNGIVIPATSAAPLPLMLSIDTLRLPLTGVGRYTQELALQLVQRPDVEPLFLQGHRVLAQLPPLVSGHPTQQRVRDSLSRLTWPVDLYRLLTYQRRRLTLRPYAQRLLHGTNYYVPGFQGPAVVTVHDASVLRLPETHRPDRVRFMRKEVARTLKQVHLVITVSEFSRREIAALWDWPLERIRVTPLAPSAVFRRHDEEELRLPLVRWGLRAQGYSLFLGTVEPRKNLPILLDAYERLPSATRERWPLVVAGYQGWESEAVHQRLRRAQSEGWARYLGFVDGEAIPALVAGARLCAMPSRYEGFGLPMLEAMASGVPVLSSTAEALQEVGGDAALYVDPDDVEGWTKALDVLLQDERQSAELGRRGLLRAAGFRWQDCAALTVAAYREVFCTYPG